MRADENAAIKRRAYEAFNRGDMNTLIELFDESAVWHLPGRSSMANDYKGRDATLAYFGQIGQKTGGTFQAELQHVLADDEDRVIGIQRMSIPCVMPSDLAAICAAIASRGRDAPLRLAWIADTLHTEVLGVSPALLAEARERADLEVVRDPAPMPFDAEGRLRPLAP